MRSEAGDGLTELGLWLGRSGEGGPISGDGAPERSKSIPCSGGGAWAGLWSGVPGSFKGESDTLGVDSGPRAWERPPHDELEPFERAPEGLGLGSTFTSGL